MSFSRRAPWSEMPGTPRRTNRPMGATMNNKPLEPQKATILVVDDDERNLRLLDSLLQAAGYRTALAATGREALQRVAENLPDLILLDVMMPEMDGWTVLATLKADEVTRDIPVVMVSFVADAALGASLGAAESLPKPVDWPRLRSVLDRIGTDAGDVLVVDDDPDMRLRLRTNLSRHGFEVREACDGAEALARVREARPGVVLLDLTMPVMDGFTFLRELRAIPACSETPVVVLSARDVSAEERRQLAGADSVLRKGDASLQDVAAAVERLRPLPVDRVSSSAR